MLRNVSALTLLKRFGRGDKRSSTLVTGSWLDAYKVLLSPSEEGMLVCGGSVRLTDITEIYYYKFYVYTCMFPDFN